MAAERRYGRRRKDADAGEVIEIHGRREWLFPLIIGAIAFLIYMMTMTPGMQMGDGTELATAAYVLGIPHPTGYPLYMLLTKLWLVVTIAGDPIVRTTLLNALLMAASVGVTALVLADLMRALWRQGLEKAIYIWAGAGALTVAFLRFHWSNAVVTEVYALQFLLMVVFTRFVQKMDFTDGAKLRRGLIGTTVCLALALAHHRLSVTMILPWLALWFFAWRKGRGAALEVRLPWIPALVALVIGASFYAYLPLRALSDPPVNWGNPDSVSRFYNHVRGTEYLDRGLLKPALGQEFSASTLALFSRLQTSHLLTDLVGQFVPVSERFEPVPGTQKIFVKGSGLVVLVSWALVALAVLGAFRLWQAGTRAFVAVVAAVALQNVIILYAYNIADIRDYFLYPFWAAWVGIFAFAAWAARGLQGEKQLLYGYVAVALPVLVLVGNWNRCNRSDDISAEVVSAMILPEVTERVPAGSILITDDDTETFTTWYRQNVRGERPDVLNFAGNFVYMPWYKTFFSDQEISEYKITLADGVARSAAEYAQQLRTGIIDANVATRPLFTSINDPAVISILADTYAVEPVDATEILNRTLFDEVSTTVLYRIKPKEQAQ